MQTTVQSSQVSGLVKILRSAAVGGTKAACSYLQHNTINGNTQTPSFPYSTVTMRP